MSSISVRFNSILSFIRFSMNTIAIPLTGKLLVGLDGLEPSTSRLSGVRSNHLSYRPFLIWLPIRSIIAHVGFPDLSGWWR